MKVTELIEILKDQHPYPTDIFMERNKEDWEKFHKVLKDNGIESGGFIGQACRIGYNACLFQIERFVEDID